MDPTALIPTASAIQVEWGWFQSLLSLTFVLHLLLMNAALGTAAMTLSSTFFGDEITHPVGKDFSTKLPTMIALAVNFGVAPLLFLQVLYGHFFYISDILMGWYWLAVPFITMAAYYLAYIFDFKFDFLGTTRGLVMSLCLTCLLAVAFLFVNNLTMFITPERWPLYFDNPGGTILNWGEPTLVPRFLHFVLASLAVGGLLTALRWSSKAKRAEDNADWHVERGMKWFFYCTLAQMLAGVWFLVAMKREVMIQFMGHSGLHTGLLLAGILGALMCLHAGFFRQPRRGALYLVVTVILMAGIREVMRFSYLEPYFKASSLEIRGEYSPMILFAVSLVIGLAIIGYVLKLASEVRRGA